MKKSKYQIKKSSQKENKKETNSSKLTMSISSSSLNSINSEKKISPQKHKKSQKISINNINVNTNNLNLNTSFNMNVNLYKRINTVANSPRSNSNISDNSSNFDKSVVNELRNQFLEITKKKNSYNLNQSNSVLTLEKTQKNLQYNINKSNEKKKKNKIGKKSLNLFDTLKNNFLNQNKKNNNKSREKLNKDKKAFANTEYCETDNFSNSELNDLNQNSTLDKTRNIKIETNTNYNSNESFQIKNIFTKFNNEINENNKLKRENYELRKWINVLKRVILSQNDNFKKKFQERENYFLNREKALIKENNTLKKIIISSFDAIKIFDKISYEYDYKINKTYSQILTENQYLRTIFLNKSNLFENERENKNYQKKINTNIKNNYHNRNISKIKVDKKEEIQEKFKTNYVNTITHFGNSNVYLNKTMKKEILNNLNYSNIRNNSSIKVMSNVNKQNQVNKLLNQIPKIKYKK